MRKKKNLFSLTNTNNFLPFREICHRKILHPSKKLHVRNQTDVNNCEQRFLAFKDVYRCMRNWNGNFWVLERMVHISILAMRTK